MNKKLFITISILWTLLAITRAINVLPYENFRKYRSPIIIIIWLISGMAFLLESIDNY